MNRAERQARITQGQATIAELTLNNIERKARREAEGVFDPVPYTPSPAPTIIHKTIEDALVPPPQSTATLSDEDALDIAAEGTGQLLKQLEQKFEQRIAALEKRLEIAEGIARGSITELRRTDAA